MKKTLSLLLALVLCLSLCACGGNDTPTANTSTEETTAIAPTEEVIDLKDVVIGTWVYKFVLTESDGYFDSRFDEVRDECSITLKIYKGGTGEFIRRNETKGYDKQTLNLTWEIQDDVIRITRPILNITDAYTHNADTNALENVDGSELFNKEN